MKNISAIIGIVVLLIFNNFFACSQSLMSDKEIFFYTMQANNINPDSEIVYAGFSGSQTFNLVDFYASYFDNINYLNSINDEFKKVPYLTGIKDEMENGTKLVDTSKIFYYLVNVTLGTYDANCGCFSLSKTILPPSYDLLDIKKIGNSELSLNGSFISFHIGEYINSNDFDYDLKMSAFDAEKFIASRKDNYGNINRKILLKVIYKVVDKHIKSNEKYEFYIGAYIHKIEFYNGSILLGSENPRIDSFTVGRDDQIYPSVKIGDQTWMTENLNYNTGSSWCYDNISSNCDKYGRLYNWSTALSACPIGWHLPSKSDFETLLNNVGGRGSNAYNALIEGGSSSFSALLGGWRFSSGSFGYVGRLGGWWSSSSNYPSGAYSLYMCGQDAHMTTNTEQEGFCVRCLKDENAENNISTNLTTTNEDLNPTACVSTTINTISVGASFKATNCSTNASSYVWEDGDGTITNASTNAPRYMQYNSAGTYTLKLTAYSASKAKSSYATVIIIAQ